MKVQDSPTPSYFEDSFPKEGFPRFDWVHKPSTLLAEAWTTETTHRDGQQGGLPLTVETKESGLAGLIFVVKQHTGHELPKTDPLVQKIADWMNQEFDHGRQTAIEWDELKGHFAELLSVPTQTKVHG